MSEQVETEEELTQEQFVELLWADAAQSHYAHTTRSELEELIESPDVRPTSRTHDWRNHVPSLAYTYWDWLPIEAKLILFAQARRDAKNEEWD